MKSRGSEYSLRGGMFKKSFVFATECFTGTENRQGMNKELCLLTLGGLASELVCDSFLKALEQLLTLSSSPPGVQQVFCPQWLVEKYICYGKYDLPECTHCYF